MLMNVLLNLLNKLGKGNKIQGLQSILLLFPIWFKNFNNTRARILVFFYPMMFKLFCNHVCSVKPSRFCQIYNIVMGVVS